MSVNYLKNDTEERWSIVQGVLYDSLAKASFLPKRNYKGAISNDDYLALQNKLYELELDFRRKGRLDELKKEFYDKYARKKEIPVSYFEEINERANLVGAQSDMDIQLRDRYIEDIISEDKKSIDSWVKVLSKNYIWYRIGLVYEILNFSNYDLIGENNFLKDSLIPYDGDTFRKLGDVIDNYIYQPELLDVEIVSLLESGNFCELYVRLLSDKKKREAYGPEGVWVQYAPEIESEVLEKRKNGVATEHEILKASLYGYNTMWNIPFIADGCRLEYPVYVYYSIDENGEYRIPRAVINVLGSNNVRIYGVASKGNLEFPIASIVEEKMTLEKITEEDRGLSYNRKDYTKDLSLIYYKTMNNEMLTEKELSFLYHLDYLQACGNFDARVYEIVARRDKRKDLSDLYNCSDDEIGFYEEDLLKPLVYYHNYIYSDKEKIPSYIFMPQIVKGNVTLANIKIAKGLKLPKIIFGNLNLSGLTSIFDLLLPEYVEGMIKYKGDEYSLEELKEIQRQEEMGIQIDLGVCFRK